MVINGKIHSIGELQLVSEKFSKRDFVLEYAENPMYPQFISLQLTQDKCLVLDEFQTGDQVEVDFNLRGREWVNPQGEKKYFNTLEAWRIKKVEAANTVEAIAAKTSLPGDSVSEADDDRLPF